MRQATYATLRLILSLAIAGGYALPMATQAQEAPRGQSNDQSKSAPELKADFIARYRLDEEAAKALADIVADNSRRIREGEVGKGDFVVHLQALNMGEIVRVIGNDFRLAPTKPFTDVTGGETELSAANYEKVIKALYDTTDANLWLRQPDMGELAPSDLQRYRKLKSIHLKEILAKVETTITANDEEAKRLFKVFNSDIKQLAVQPSREVFRLLFSTAVSLAEGEAIFSGVDEARKTAFSTFLLTQLMAREILTKSNFKEEGGVIISLGKAGQYMRTQILPAMPLVGVLPHGDAEISAQADQARRLAVKALSVNYEAVMRPLLNEANITKLEKEIAEGKATIAYGKQLDANIENIRLNRENIRLIGKIRKEINEHIHNLIASTSKKEQQEHVMLVNKKMKDFFKVRAEIQLSDTGKNKMATMIEAINTDIAIIRGHPKLIPFDKELVPFSLDEK